MFSWLKPCIIYNQVSRHFRSSKPTMQQNCLIKKEKKEKNRKKRKMGFYFRRKLRWSVHATIGSVDRIFSAYWVALAIFFFNAYHGGMHQLSVTPPKEGPQLLLGRCVSGHQHCSVFSTSSSTLHFYNY